MVNNRGQAALEFLMTYGWAILVVLASIAALAFFGVLSPERFLPETCTMQSGINCVDAQATAASGVTIVMLNGLGFDMENVTVAINDCGTNVSNTTIVNGEQDTFVVTCSPALTAGSRFQEDVNISYVNSDSGLAHTAKGRIVKTVQ